MHFREHFFHLFEILGLHAGDDCRDHRHVSEFMGFLQRKNEIGQALV